MGLMRTHPESESTPVISNPGFKERIYDTGEFFEPGEIMAIKSLGDTLVDPLPIIAKLGIVVEPEKTRDLLKLILGDCEHLAFEDTKEGQRMKAKYVEELLTRTYLCYWTIGEHFLPEKSASQFYGDMQQGFMELQRRMIRDERERLARRDNDWSK